MLLSIYIFELCHVEKTKINKKEAGIGPFKKWGLRSRREKEESMSSQREQSIVLNFILVIRTV